FNSKFKFRSGVPLIRMNSFKSFGRQLAFQHNYLMFLYKENSNKWYSPNGFSDVWHDILYKTGYRTIGNIFHPDSIPEELVSRCIQLTSIKGDWVLDPFAGAGTVGKVCQDLDRNCIMFEIDEKWKSVIKQRCKLNYKKLEENGQHYIKIASERIFKNSKAIEEFDNDEEKNVSKQ
ncbi:MAG: site-specific DNA-methyltransferase, partial [Candidatus Thermoplasmatota archaeon]